MKQDYQQLLKPEIINRVSGLALIGRVIVDGYLSGLNQSRRLGPGLEFSQYRGYEPGDDLRLLDWKMLARSGRYYIRQSEVETNINIKFILDTSKSMLHQEDGLSKMDYVKVLVASLAYLAFEQGDAVGLFALNDQEMQRIFPKAQKQHYNRLLSELIAIRSQGKWPKDPKLSQRLQDRSHKELIFFISDMYESEQELSTLIRTLKTSRNEVVLLQVLGRKELEFDFKGSLTFEDLETGERLKLNAGEARSAYLRSMDDMIKATKENLLSSGITYQLFRLDEPLGETLQVFLKKRKNLI